MTARSSRDHRRPTSACAPLRSQGARRGARSPSRPLVRRRTRRARVSRYPRPALRRGTLYTRVEGPHAVRSRSRACASTTCDTSVTRWPRPPAQARRSIAAYGPGWATPQRALWPLIYQHAARERAPKRFPVTRSTRPAWSGPDPADATSPLGTCRAEPTMARAIAFVDGYRSDRGWQPSHRRAWACPRTMDRAAQACRRASAPAAGPAARCAVRNPRRPRPAPRRDLGSQPRQRIR